MMESLLGLDSWIAAAEEVCLQPASEGGKRRCRRDVLRQTVPNTAAATGKARSPIVDSRVRRTNSDDDVVERRLALAGWLS